MEKPQYGRMAFGKGNVHRSPQQSENKYLQYLQIC